MIKILFTGDFCPHQRIEKLTTDGHHDLVFNDFKKEFEHNDLNVVDLECPLTLETTKIEKTGPHQKAHPKTIELLKEINIDLVAMANNHILDYGNKALLETIELCNKNNIKTIGVGKNSSEAKLPVIKEIQGLKIGFLNFCESEWTIAKVDQPGANPIDLIENFNAIQSLKQKVDKLIVIAHGGNEFYHLPSPRLKKTYRYFIDAGADVVISHHTHCFTGYEVYKKAPIFYGLGNFIYDRPDKKNDNWNFGYVVRLTIDDQIKFEIVPFKQNNGDQLGVHYLDKNETKEFNLRLEKLNNIISNNDHLEEAFQKLCNQKEGIYSLYFEPYRGKILSALRIRKLLPNLFSKRKKMAQLNILRCDSHRDILLKTLEKKIKNK
jgi:poly-gamma-glutamate synthesis protein (capsule biosynthesis protein)